MNTQTHGNLHSLVLPTAFQRLDTRLVLRTSIYYMQEGIYIYRPAGIFLVAKTCFAWSVSSSLLFLKNTY